MLVTILMPVSPASADTGITVFPPQAGPVLVGNTPVVTVVVRSVTPGPTSCPGATSAPDPDSTCHGIHIRLAFDNFVGDYIPIPGSFVPGPDPVTKQATTAANCAPGFNYRGEFSHLIVDVLDDINRIDLRWGQSASFECFSDVTVPQP